MLDANGISVGSARVKTVLINVSLNPREYDVKCKILKAECRPRKPKPTATNANPVPEVDGVPTKVANLPADVLSVLAEAESSHEETLRSDYERDHVKNYDENKKKEYKNARKVASDENNFNVQEFNTAFEKNFYREYPAYKVAKDSYIVGKTQRDMKSGQDRVKYNEWTRAAALVNKLCTRLSGNTRNLIACFLDRIVEQYARNGIHNVLERGRRIVYLRHLLANTSGFNERVPLNRFVCTLNCYLDANDFLTEYESVKTQNKALKADNKEELPAVKYVDEDENGEYKSTFVRRSQYDKNDHAADFETYVNDICRSVKLRLSEEAKTTEAKELYQSVNIGQEVKRFCSYVIYESILRIGELLRLSVVREGVKTISDKMVHYVLQQIHVVNGIDFDRTNTEMLAHLVKFTATRVLRKADRRRKQDEQKNAPTTNGTNGVHDEEDVEEEDEDEEDVEEDDEVEYEDK
jgi:hypothetical protein